jgi:hypothetical protein
VSQHITCSACGVDLAGSAEPGSRCPACGDTGRTVHLGLVRETNTVLPITLLARNPNSPRDRRRTFESALSAVQAAIDDNSAGAAQDAVKAALEMIHELEDGRRKPRFEWTLTGWTPAEEDQWRAHVGARNAAHHYSSEAHGIVALGSGDHRDDRLTWDVDPKASAGVRKHSKYGPLQAKAYEDHLAGKPVVPGLRQIAALLERSIAD